MSMNISRRSFMKGAAAASLAVAASTMLTGCDMPSVGDLFGSLGTKKGSFTIDGSTVSVTLSGFRQDEYGNFVVTAKVNNTSKQAVTLASEKKNSGYYIVPALSNPDTPAADYDYFDDLSKITVEGKNLPNGELAGSKTAEWRMVFQPGANATLWEKLELTMTLYNNGNEDGEPVTFTYKK